ncbi:MAG: hypothetical protein R3B40_02235 [Polyangiales bacterium]|nr:hypothetical protein [Myxococcales bacterium]MCB9657110.1 hypothetical protein [Sandaracinaceae bacterium]
MDRAGWLLGRAGKAAAITLTLMALAPLAAGCDDTPSNAGRCSDLPRPTDPIASPDEPGRVPCALRPPHLR